MIRGKSLLPQPNAPASRGRRISRTDAILVSANTVISHARATSASASTAFSRMDATWASAEPRKLEKAALSGHLHLEEPRKLEETRKAQPDQENSRQLHSKNLKKTAVSGLFPLEVIAKIQNGQANQERLRQLA